MKPTQTPPELAEALESQVLRALSCPFCGTADPTTETVRLYRNADWRSKMQCTACGASSGWSDPMDHDSSERSAIEIWNRRVNAVPQPSTATEPPAGQSPVHLASG
jgi:Lar family restriction alleviation protein